MFLIDECHLLWGDVCGYAWGRSDLRIEIPIKNERERQTYYGALDYRTKEFILKGYETANSKNTEDFVKFLQGQRPGQKIAIFGDRATYHCSQEFRNYLDSLNQDKEAEQWQIICHFFAPYAPEQNPVEDIWLQAKTFLRQFFHLCTSFSLVKWLFEFFTDRQVFDFPKIYDYGVFT